MSKEEQQCSEDEHGVLQESRDHEGKASLGVQHVEERRKRYQRVVHPQSTCAKNDEDEVDGDRETR